MLRRNTWICILVITTIMLQSILAPTAFAQTNNTHTDSMGIRGVIKYENGTGMSDAKIEVYTNNTTVASTFSNQDGEYYLQLTNVGRYNLRVIKNGYKTSITTSIIVSPDRITTLFVSMHKAEKDGIPVILIACPLRIDPLNPSNRTITSEEIEKMPR